MKLSILSEMFSRCWWWLFFWMLLAFILGWLLSKLFSGGGEEDNECCEDAQKWRDKYNKLLAKKTAPVQTVIPAAKRSGVVASASPYARLKEDFLQIIEGIGPKMNEILNKYGIRTWADLASKTHDELREILDKENPKRYKIINPKTWPEQAALARDGKWEELIRLQKELDAGKENAMGETDSKLEKMMVKLGLIKKWKENDLKAIEGIGPKIEKILKENGIDTWKKLAETQVDRLKEILEKAGKRFQLADPGSWPEQAGLAAAGKWKDLEELQDRLIGGK